MSVLVYLLHVFPFLIKCDSENCEREILEEILSYHTGQPIDRVHKDTDRDFVMEAQAAKDYGIIDEVISTRAFADRSGPIR